MNQKKILIVDDDSSIREIISTQLSRLNFLTLSAANGKEAVELFKSEKPDLVLMDMLMPVMDGLTACQKIRALEKKGARIPILFLTARDSRHDQISSTLSGGDDFITKPISLQELRERVLEILQRAQDDGQRLFDVAAHAGSPSSLVSLNCWHRRSSAAATWSVMIVASVASVVISSAVAVLPPTPPTPPPGTTIDATTASPASR